MENVPSWQGRLSRASTGGESALILGGVQLLEGRRDSKSMERAMRSDSIMQMPIDFIVHRDRGEDECHNKGKQGALSSGPHIAALT